MNARVHGTLSCMNARSQAGMLQEWARFLSSLCILLFVQRGTYNASPARPIGARKRWG